MIAATLVTQNEAQLRRLVEAWSRAIGAKDADAVASTQSAGFSHCSLAPPLRHGAEPAGLKAWFATWDGPIAHEVRDLELQIGDQVAFAHGLVRMGGAKTTGERNSLWFRLTLGFHKTGDAWLITHEHDSVPFYMDGSLRAAVDLQP